MRCFIYISVLLLITAALLSVPVLPVRAQAGTAADLIAAVNAFRAANGLPAYTIDAGLMSAAQAHSDYQASIGTATHVRADGTQPADLGFIENICAGLNRSVENVIYTCWQDNLHQSTMVGIASGSVGAGVAVADNVAYYTLVVHRTGADVPFTPHTSSSSSSSAEQVSSPTTDAAQLLMQVETVVPAANGSIIHEVKPGQSAWSVAIAYNIKIADLIALNGLAATPVLYAGQKLIIQPAFTPTLSPTVTKTTRPPTRTPTPTRTPKPPTPTPTITPTVTPTVFSVANVLPSLPSVDQHTLGIGIIAICGIGLAAVLITSFRKSKD